MGKKVQNKALLQIINLSDARLIKRLQEGDQKAFKEIFKLYWSKLYIYAYNILRERSICEDIIQEIFFDLWIRRNDLCITNLNAYLYQAVKYQICKYIRKSKHKEQLLDDLDVFMTFQISVEDNFERIECSENVRDAISKLPMQRRLIFELSRNENLSNKEISEKLGISIQTVKNQISKALKFIRHTLKNTFFIC
ncbi:RNA polymerase sigma factor [Melioribacteraceae bacterium 4301-Me]|uniref:RNA polymerase sigma factor n=1 Tax=Pyranulibacter aquaticus TaxID=3163344 RepID=UPI003598B9FE